MWIHLDLYSESPIPKITVSSGISTARFPKKLASHLCEDHALRGAGSIEQAAPQKAEQNALVLQPVHVSKLAWDLMAVHRTLERQSCSGARPAQQANKCAGD